jgi:DNA recombination-dependent growth factor C
VLSKFQIKNRKSKKRIIEERIYEMVAEELQCGEKRIGLWTKALGQAEGDHAKAEGIYINLRAESMIDEAKVVDEVLSSEVRKKETTKKELTPEQKEKKKKKSDYLDKYNRTGLTKKSWFRLIILWIISIIASSYINVMTAEGKDILVIFVFLNIALLYWVGEGVSKTPIRDKIKKNICMVRVWFHYFNIFYSGK